MTNKTLPEKDINDYSRKELESLPYKKWNEKATYDSILLLSRRRKHESGWALIYVIGVNKKPIEIATGCSDDIEWKTPASKNFGRLESGEEILLGPMRMDCCYRSSAMHFWSNEYRFLVSEALSSISITLVKEK